MFEGPSKRNLDRYGKNKPYCAINKDDIVGIVPNGSTILTYSRFPKDLTSQLYQLASPDTKTVADTDMMLVKKDKDVKILYDGRYCAVSGFIFGIYDGKYSVLANKRGKGTPDYQGYWNCPCGYLEKYENSKEGIAREILEECHFHIDLDKLKVIYTETDPKECNNGNVTVRHMAFVGNDTYKFDWENHGGEKDEVDSVKWIPVDEIDDYEWAFNHKATIKKLIPSKLKIRLIEFYYNYIEPFTEIGLIV